MRGAQRRSVRQEREAAQRLGGSVTPGSGNQWARKNDVRTQHWSLEYKTTDALSYRLSERELIAAERHALLDGRSMAFGVSFSAGRNWIVIAEDDFVTLTEGIR